MNILNLFKKKSIYSDLIKEKKQELIDNGSLKPIYLIDIRFGGSDKIDNIVYVPANIVTIKENIDNELENFLLQGRKITNYNCIPKYKGKSSIPCEIKITARIDNNEQYERKINVW